MKALFVAACLSAMTLPAFGQTQGKEELASRFFDATTARQLDGQAMLLAEIMLENQPTKKGQAEIYRKWAKEAYSSPEYRQIFVTYFVETFSTEELMAMNEWAKHPSFVRYLEKTAGFTQWSAPRYQKVMAAKIPELNRRLRAEGFEPSKF